MTEPTSTQKTKPRRVLLKISGEALNGPDRQFPFDPETVQRIAFDVAHAYREGAHIAIVVGGGNIFRGATGASKGMDRVEADHFGMLATVQNGIVMRDMLSRVCGIQDVRLMSAIEMPKVAEPFIVPKAQHHLAQGRIIIIGGGTGNSNCTTDYAAALRGTELHCDIVLKATNIDGVYNKDPRKHPDAQLFRHVGFSTCLDLQLEVMDTEAFALCRRNRLPIRVFSQERAGNITRAIMGEDIGTLVTNEL